MVIFFNMIVKRYASKILLTISLLSCFTFFASKVQAAEPFLSFYPTSGIIKDVDEGFTVDVLLDSQGRELAKVTAAFHFDPDQIQIRQASRNNSLFEQWPDDESALDNENGVVMLTGFTQSGSGQPYSTSGEPDVFARVEFDVITEDKNEQILLQWEFGDNDPLFETALIVDGSPPQNILDSVEFENQPQDAVFRFGELSQTAIDKRHIPFIVGGILILIAGIIITSRPEFTRKKYGTVVVYDE
jgi:hypothetical protein